MKRVGTLREITRHPVKSMTGETVKECLVESYGLYGDRSHVLIDESKERAFLTITQVPELVKFRARFNGEEDLSQYPQVEVTTPDGTIYDWSNIELVKQIEEIAGREISQHVYSPSHVPLGAIEEEPILITTDASLNVLKKLWGQDVDNRRFRPNLYIDLDEKEAFVEETWIGKTLKVGEVELRVQSSCERCMIVTVNPETSKKDPSLLKTIAKERNNIFGVYASVKKKGKIRVGDQIYLLS